MSATQSNDKPISTPFTIQPMVNAPVTAQNSRSPTSSQSKNKSQMMTNGTSEIKQQPPLKKDEAIKLFKELISVVNKNFREVSNHQQMMASRILGQQAGSTSGQFYGNSMNGSSTNVGFSNNFGNSIKDPSGTSGKIIPGSSSSIKALAANSPKLKKVRSSKMSKKGLSSSGVILPGSMNNMKQFSEVVSSDQIINQPSSSMVKEKPLDIFGSNKKSGYQPPSSQAANNFSMGNFSIGSYHEIQESSQPPILAHKSGFFQPPSKSVIDLSSRLKQQIYWNYDLNFNYEMMDLEDDSSSSSIILYNSSNNPNSSNHPITSGIEIDESNHEHDHYDMSQQIEGQQEQENFHRNSEPRTPKKTAIEANHHQNQSLNLNNSTPKNVDSALEILKQVQDKMEEQKRRKKQIERMEIEKNVQEKQKSE